MNDNPTRALIAAAPMHPRQFLIVILCGLINMSDGFDVLSLALAAPELTREWGVSPELLGMTFSATSVGLVIGAFLVAPLADRVGRRSVILAALFIITAVHWLSAVAGSIWIILYLRLAMGVALGTLVVSLNVMVSEFSNDRWRNILVSLLHTGFSIGMAVGGAVAAQILEPLGWRYIFVSGGILNFSVLALAVIFLMESPEYLTSLQPRNALARINAILVKLNHAPLSALPPLQSAARRKVSYVELLSPELRNGTILIWVASLSYAVVGYFLLNWKPQILVNAGLTPTQASYVGVVNGVLGTVGHVSIGVLSRWVNEMKLTGIYFACLVVMLIVFSMLPSEPLVLLGGAGVLTLFTVGAYTGLFLIAIRFYSAETRTTGVGFVVGWGRIGAVIGPMLGGLLIGGGFDRIATFSVFAGIASIPVVMMFIAVRGQPRTLAVQK